MRTQQRENARKSWHLLEFVNGLPRVSEELILHVVLVAACSCPLTLAEEWQL